MWQDFCQKENKRCRSALVFSKNQHRSGQVFASLLQLRLSFSRCWVLIGSRGYALARMQRYPTLWLTTVGRTTFGVNYEGATTENFKGTRSTSAAVLDFWTGFARPSH